MKSLEVIQEFTATEACQFDNELKWKQLKGGKVTVKQNLLRSSSAMSIVMANRINMLTDFAHSQQKQWLLWSIRPGK